MNCFKIMKQFGEHTYFKIFLEVLHPYHNIFSSNLDELANLDLDEFGRILARSVGTGNTSSHVAPPLLSCRCKQPHFMSHHVMKKRWRSLLSSIIDRADDVLCGELGSYVT